MQTWFVAHENHAIPGTCCTAFLGLNVVMPSPLNRFLRNFPRHIREHFLRSFPHHFIRNYYAVCCIISCAIPAPFLQRLMHHSLGRSAPPALSYVDLLNFAGMFSSTIDWRNIFSSRSSSSSRRSCIAKCSMSSGCVRSSSCASGPWNLRPCVSLG